MFTDKAENELVRLPVLYLWIVAYVAPNTNCPGLSVPPTPILRRELRGGAPVKKRENTVDPIYFDPVANPIFPHAVGIFRMRAPSSDCAYNTSRCDRLR